MRTVSMMIRAVVAAGVCAGVMSCTEAVFDNPVDPEGTGYAPVSLSVTGSNPLTIEVGDQYVDSGVVVTSASGEDLSRAVEVGGEAVSTTAVDTYTVVYTVRDAHGYSASCSRTVIVVPAGTINATKPRITLTGGDTLFHTVRTAFVDPGATARDAQGTDISSSIVVGGTVTDTMIGTYVLTYTASDEAGNQSTKVRIVRVISGDIQVDVKAPVITVLGPNPASVGVGLPYIDEGATALDSADGDVSGSIQTRSTVNTDSAGTDTVVYTVSDRAGNRAEARRLVRVVLGDAQVPIITLLGLNPLVLTIGDTLRDPGATAYDSVDGTLTTRIVMEHNVNVRAAGTYSMIYRVSDAAGNQGTKTRIVQVRPTVSADSVPPVITLRGPTPMVLTVGATFRDSGATARDDMDGDISSRIQSTNNVNTAVAGSYTVTYTVSDQAGNQATKSRIVTVREPVVDTTKPVIALAGSDPMRLAVGATYTEPGATATDNVDGNLTSAIVVTGTVNTAAAGTYTKTYTVRDAAGNTATKTRTVIVSAGGAAELQVNVNIVGDNNTTYTFARYSNENGWTPSELKVIIQPASGGQVSGSITVNGTTYPLTTQYYNAIVVPNANATVTCTITGAFQIGLGL